MTRVELRAALQEHLRAATTFYKRQLRLVETMELPGPVSTELVNHYNNCIRDAETCAGYVALNVAQLGPETDRQVPPDRK